MCKKADSADTSHLIFLVYYSEYQLHPWVYSVYYSLSVMTDNLVAYYEVLYKLIDIQQELKTRILFSNLQSIILYNILKDANAQPIPMKHCGKENWRTDKPGGPNSSQT